MTEKHIPLRMCVACRQMKPQSELIRLVREHGTNGIKTDTDKKLFGRGAYLCKNEECIKKARKRNGLARHFACAVPDEIYDVLDRSLREMKKG